MINAARPVRVLRIHCPVRPETFAALLAGRGDAIEADPVAGRLLAIIRAANPLGDFGRYTGVVEIGLGYESFVPSADAAPVQGAAGAVSTLPTIILTTYVADEAPEDGVSEALAQLVAAHPWEVPVIEIGAARLLVRP